MENPNFNLGEYLKMIRNNAGLSTRKLSELIGFSHSYINSVENGVKTKPSEEFIESYIYGVSGEDLNKINQHAKTINSNTNYNIDYVETTQGPIEVSVKQYLTYNFMNSHFSNVNDKDSNRMENMFQVPIDDIQYHLTENKNTKYFASIRLTNDDKKHIYQMIKDYLIQKYKIEKAHIDELKRYKDFEFPDSEKYIKELNEFIEHLKKDKNN